MVITNLVTQSGYCMSVSMNMVIANGSEYGYHECECESDYGYEYDYCVSVSMVIMSESILIVSMVIVSMSIGEDVYLECEYHEQEYSKYGWLLCEYGCECEYSYCVHVSMVMYEYGYCVSVWLLV